MRAPEKCLAFCRQLPRNQLVGRVLMLIGLAWSLELLRQMDLGPWGSYKIAAYLLSPLVYWFLVARLNDYLGARGIALLLVLAAHPVLRECFLRDEAARLVLTCLAYAWIVAGLCVFCVPHWMRDVFAALSLNPRGWRAFCKLKLALGALLLALGVFVY